MIDASSWSRWDSVCQVFSFKQPSHLELDHDFLWRTTCRLPERGRIGIFNRSYYEEVLVVRVHPEYLEKQKLPMPISPHIWEERYESICNHELHLANNGTLILKFWLNVSKEEQRKRLLSRLTEPEKHWKFSKFFEMISATHMRMNGLSSAGIAYQGAHDRDVAFIAD